MQNVYKQILMKKKVNFSNFSGISIKGKGSAKIDKGQKTTTVKHNVKIKPVSIDDIFITLRTGIDPISNVWVSNLTEDSFDINVKEAVNNPVAITWGINAN